MAYAAQVWVADRIVLSAVIDNVTRLDCPPGSVLVFLRPLATSAKVTYVGIDGAAIGPDYASLPADQTAELPISGRGALFVAGESSATIEFVFVDQRRLGQE